MTDRALPKWMSKREKPSDKDSHKQHESENFKKNVIEDDLPYLEFTGTIVYSHEKNDCSFLSEDLRSGLLPGDAVGFDIEWPPCFVKGQKKKVALVQLCASEDKCYLFHLSSMSGFPHGLKRFLEDESIKKVGVGIEGDMWKLLSDFDIKLKSFVELGSLANDRLRCVEKWSLDGLLKHLFTKRLCKQKDVRCSKWDDFHLSEEQRRYAAADAYAGLIIYNKLESMDLAGIPSTSLLKEKLLRTASAMEQLAGSLPEELDDIQSVAELVEVMSAKLSSLEDLLMKSRVTPPTSIKALLSDDPLAETRDSNQNPSANTTHILNQEADPALDSSGVDLFKAPEPAGDGMALGEAPDYQREFVMSLDVSEYELQMLERQALQEDLEEQSTLEFQEKRGLAPSAADLSYEVKSDEELESEMLQCVDEVEKSRRDEERKEGLGDEKTEEEEEVEEEEEEEEFDSSLPAPKPEQIKCLKMYFGHRCFKPVQWKVIHSVLVERRDNLVVMATGYGKSLCFQFPPVYCGGLSLVISPLIALMEDQVFQLRMSNIPACFLGSAQTQDVHADLKQGKFRVVYMTPEFCSSNMALLEQLNRSIGLSLIAVDEAHCISEWGHDFRGAYQRLGNLKRSLPDVPIVALTATASPSIRADIVKSLSLDRPIVTCTSFDRPNLFLNVGRKSGDMLSDLKLFLNKTGVDYEFEGASIVYCPTRKEAERVTASLFKLGVSCGVYHAGLGIKERRDTQHRFMKDQIQCIVATVAFGMGINKPDIRQVIHYGAPKEMESYYQEMGRAGRDGLPSTCNVLWAPGDLSVNRFLLNKVANDRFRGYKLKMMGKMEQYLVSSKCRRKLILSHFEDKQLRRVTSGILGTDQCCDNCKSGSTDGSSLGDCNGGRQDFGPLAFQLMGAVSAMGERFGSTAPILFLRGSTSQRVPPKYRAHPLFGAGRGVAEACWKALVRQLIMEEYLVECTGLSRFSTLCKITPKGDCDGGRQDFGPLAFQLMGAVSAMGERFGSTERLGFEDIHGSPLLFVIIREIYAQGMKWLTQAVDEERKRSLLLQPVGDLSSWAGLRPLRPAPTFVPCPVPSSTSQTSCVTSTLSRYAIGKPRPKSAVPPIGSPAKAEVAKPQPPPLSPREIQLQTELYSILVAERQKLALEKNIPPAIMATNKILLDMAKIRPRTVSHLKTVDGVSEAKSSMLAPLLETIASFCEAHQLKVDSLAPGPTPGVWPLGSTPRPRVPSSLPDSVSLTYRLFQQQGKTMRQVCDVRTLPSAVVESHLLQAYRADHPLDTERAGLTRAVLDSISHAMRSQPLNSDLSDLKALRSRVPEDISFFLLQLAVAVLQREGPTAPPGGPSRLLQANTVPPPPPPQEITWIEKQERVPNRVAAPDRKTPPSEVNRPAPLDTNGLSSAAKPASWRCELQDEDIEELFRDSAVLPPLKKNTAPDPVPVPLPVLLDSSPSPWAPTEPGEMVMSEEDELFKDIPMPEEREVFRSSSSVATDPSSKMEAKASPVWKASWNYTYQPADEETEQLFSDSPPRNLSQPSKRKLPDWIAAPKGSVSSSSSSSTSTLAKKPKKKKGLFS